MKLNLITNREMVRDALIKMGDYIPGEGEGTFAAACRFVDGKDEGFEDEYKIYGSAGVNRYLVNKNGGIALSARNASTPAKIEKARSLGFEIDE